MKDLVLKENSSTIQQYGGGAGGYFTGTSNITIHNCEFLLNSGYDFGAAICCRMNSTLLCTGSTFSGNIVAHSGAHSKGGAVMVDNNASARFENCLFYNNMTIKWGGAIGLNGYADLEVVNCTFSGNDASEGGGAIYLCYTGVNVFVGNCIMYDNFPEELYFDTFCFDDTVKICNSDIEGLLEIQVPETNLFQLIDENIDLDPLFLDPLNADFTLDIGSPCIDAGTNYYSENSYTYIHIPDSLYNGFAPDLGAFESDFWLQLEEPDTAEPQMQVWPQPAADQVNIFMPGLGEQTELRIVNLQGEELGQRYVIGGEEVLTISVHSYPPGVYLLQFLSKSHSSTRKIVIE
jgi:hypothetical protein